MPYAVHTAVHTAVPYAVHTADYHWNSSSYSCGAYGHMQCIMPYAVHTAVHTAVHNAVHIPVSHMHIMHCICTRKSIFIEKDQWPSAMEMLKTFLNHTAVKYDTSRFIMLCQQ